MVALQEATTGSSLLKAALRLVGTLLGGAVGLGVYGFVILCNGLSHANHPQKVGVSTSGARLGAGGRRARVH